MSPDPTRNGISPELFAVIQAHARKLAAAAPTPTAEDIAQLRRWFTPEALRRAAAEEPGRRNVA